MKYYDKGFITKFENYTKVEILNSGTSILQLEIYKDRICKSTFKCLSSKDFNKEFLSTSYKDDFLKNLFDKNEKKTIFRDKKNRVLIKIIKD